MNGFQPSTIRTDKVYISSDVDVLGNRDIPTEDYSRGMLTLDDLVKIISPIAKVNEIVGEKIISEIANII